MDKNFFVFPMLLLAIFVPFAYAESHDGVTANVLESDGTSAKIEMTWISDDASVKYEVGCVSCMPNTSEFVFEDNVILEGVTSFANTNDAMLYLISYDSNDEIIHAKQIIVSLG